MTNEELYQALKTNNVAALNDLDQVDFTANDFKYTMEDAISEGRLEVARAIMAVPKFQRSLTANEFSFVMSAIRANQPILVKELLSIPPFHEKRENFDILNISNSIRDALTYNQESAAIPLIQYLVEYPLKKTSIPRIFSPIDSKQFERALHLLRDNLSREQLSDMLNNMILILSENKVVTDITPRYFKILATLNFDTTRIPSDVQKKLQGRGSELINYIIFYHDKQTANEILQKIYPLVKNSLSHEFNKTDFTVDNINKFRQDEYVKNKVEDQPITVEHPELANPELTVQTSLKTIIDMAPTNEKRSLTVKDKQNGTKAFMALKWALPLAGENTLRKEAEWKGKSWAKMNIIADSEVLCELMPPPDPTDPDLYTHFYSTIQAIARSNKLAHRFDIDGSAVGMLNNHEIDYVYGGSEARRMIPEMQKSFHRFMKDNRASFEAILTEYNVPLSILDDVQADMGSSPLNKFDVDFRIGTGEPIFIPTHTQDYEPHLMAVAFHNNLCLIADRGNKEYQGARIFQMGMDTPNKRKMVVDNIDPRTRRTYNELTAFLKKELALSNEPIDIVPFTPQFAANCSWSSSAKMMPLASFYFRVYEKNGDLKTAHKVAKACYKAWSDSDQVAHLRDYLKEPQPDLLLLGKIYLTTKGIKPHQAQVKKMLEESGLLTPQVLDKAKKALLIDAEDTLKKAYQIAGQTQPAWLTPEIKREVSQLCADIYLNKNKNETVTAVKFFIEKSLAVKTPDEVKALLSEMREKFLSSSDPSRKSLLMSKRSDQSPPPRDPTPTTKKNKPN